MKVYNTKILKNNQRFTRAILIGLLSSIGCAIGFAFFEIVITWHVSLIYIAMAYGISYCIKNYGKGVESKYSILGVVFVIFSILLGKFLVIAIGYGFSFTLLPFYLRMLLQSLFVVNANGIIEILCIAYAMYVAYYNARII